MTQTKTANHAALTSKPGNKKPQGKGQKPNTQRHAYSHAQTQMESKLSTLFNLSTQRARGQLAELKAIGEEGEGHINVHRNSKTKLGFLLSTAAQHDFTLFNKRFTSIDNLMMYYRSHCTVDALATGSVALARDFNRNRVKSYPSVKNLFVLACLGYMEIFKRNPVLLQAMEQNALPLDSYDLLDQGKQRKRHPASGTLVSAVQEAFQAVRDNREPDLKKFMFNDLARVLATRATLEGKTFLETATSEFSPRAFREEFNNKHAELAAQIRDEEQKRRQAQKEQRNAKKAEPAVELGDTNEIIKGTVGLEKIEDDVASSTEVAVEETAVAVDAEVAKVDAAPVVEQEAVAEVAPSAVAPITE